LQNIAQGVNPESVTNFVVTPLGIGLTPDTNFTACRNKHWDVMS
ncbi:unnamed protein product, partial [marine sediment metagenome]